MKRAVGETADEVWCPVCENVGWSPIDGDYTCPLCHTVVRMTLTDGIVGYQETQPRAAWRHLVDPDPTPAVNRRPVGATVNQRVVARECLIALAVFVGSLFVVIPVAALLMEPSQSVTEFVGNASGFTATLWRVNSSMSRDCGRFFLSRMSLFRSVDRWCGPSRDCAGKVGQPDAPPTSEV